MCGIGGVASLTLEPLPRVHRALAVMNELQAHRGPDGEATWVHLSLGVGFAHRRLKIIDPEGGAQPMTDRRGNWITFNGEIYNYLELRRELGEHRFATRSDTEVILEAYAEWGDDALARLRGMFAFALWDERGGRLLCARDRLGIKPLYYTVADGVLHFASEIKALLPFLASIEVDTAALKDYLTFQFCLEGKTLFAGVRELLPGHCLTLRDGTIQIRRYWAMPDAPDVTRDRGGVEEEVHRLVSESVALHLRADVPVGAYVSGGLDSSVIARLARTRDAGLIGFTGGFAEDGYDETSYARSLAEHADLRLEEVRLGADDLVDDIEALVYHLDVPVAGPGSLPQYVVARRAAAERRVLLGGQGADEVFGGYPRYLIAHRNLRTLPGYEPLLEEFWRDGPLDELDQRYFRLINRGAGIGDEVDWSLLGDYSPYETFRAVFAEGSAGSYLGAMTRFDCRASMPALLHVEDRTSMAHGVELRLPFLDHPLVERAARLPADVRFNGGTLKHVLREAFAGELPEAIVRRTDKMGFPVPFQEWLTRPGAVRDFVGDTLSSDAARSRPLIDNAKVLAALSQEPRYGRRVWGLLCLELWQSIFLDRAQSFRGRLESRPGVLA